MCSSSVTLQPAVTSQMFLSVLGAARSCVILLTDGHSESTGHTDVVARLQGSAPKLSGFFLGSLYFCTNKASILQFFYRNKFLQGKRVWLILLTEEQTSPPLRSLSSPLLCLLVTCPQGVSFIVPSFRSSTNTNHAWLH